MNGETAWAVYETRLRRVSNHIHEHLDEELDMDGLAEIACLSPYHWHRIYRAIYGETAAATVKRLRLHRAAGDIVETDLGISEIAKRSGYPNVQSFNRIFKAVYGMPPARYRKEGSHTLFESKQRKASIMFDISIRTLKPTEVVGVSHQGSYMGIGKAFEQLFGTLYARGQGQAGQRMIGIYLDDPDVVAVDKLRSYACVETDAAQPVQAPLERRTLEGGDYAVLRHKGPYAEMHKAYTWLYGEWLPMSGRKLRDTVMFEEYLNNPRDVAPAELLTDINLPLV